MHSLGSAAPHMAVQADAGSANSATDVTFVGSVAVGVAGGEWCFPACTLLHGGFCQVVLTSLQVSCQGASPSGTVSRKGFPVFRVHLKCFHVALADVPESQLWPSGLPLSSCQLSVQEVFGDSPIVHPSYVSKPAKPALPEKGVHGREVGTGKDLCVGNFVLP